MKYDTRAAEARSPGSHLSGLYIMCDYRLSGLCDAVCLCSRDFLSQPPVRA